MFLIESRTGHLAARARQAMAPFLTDDTVRHRDLAFFDAFAQRREPPFPVRIHDLERYAAHWAPLVPANPRSRAALAHLLGQKYEFTRDTAPALGAAVGFDDERVAGAYQQLYGAPLDKIFADEVGRGGRLRWLWTRIATRLESLPPAWSAYVLSLTETVGTSMLALPIAVAGIGPLAGVVVIVVLGLVNIVTAAAMAEAVGRSGSVRYGAAYIGKMVHDYLGRAGLGGAHRGPVRPHLPDPGGQSGRHRLDHGRGHGLAARGFRRHLLHRRLVHYPAWISRRNHRRRHRRRRREPDHDRGHRRAFASPAWSWPTSPASSSRSWPAGRSSPPWSDPSSA